MSPTKFGISFDKLFFDACTGLAGTSAFAFGTMPSAFTLEGGGDVGVGGGAVPVLLHLLHFVKTPLAEEGRMVEGVEGGSS